MQGCHSTSFSYFHTSRQLIHPTDKTSPAPHATESEQTQENTLFDARQTDFHSLPNTAQQYQQRLELPTVLLPKHTISSIVPHDLLGKIITQQDTWIEVYRDASSGRKYSAIFYPEHKLIRLAEGARPPSRLRAEYVNIWLDESLEAGCIDQESGNNNARIFRLVEAGMLKDTVFIQLGIGFSPEEIDQAKQAEEQVERQNNIYSRQLVKDSVSTLIPIHQYATDSTLVVPTGSVYTFSPVQCPNMGLYTGGAGPCQILIALGKDGDGTLQQITMGHIDCNVGHTALVNLFKRLVTGVNGGCLEVSLIGGMQRTALRVIRAAYTVEAKINFASANFSQQRGDDAAVDMEGKIYYGHSAVLRNKSIPEVTEPRSCFLHIEKQLNIKQVQNNSESGKDDRKDS